jgi:putative spermidine/putrescine transport system substrate-binding protein
MKKTISIFILVAVVLSACTVSGNTSQQGSSAYDINNWDSVLAAANGQTVNWYIWGGSESINSFVDVFYGKELKERYNITLNRVPVADTVDAVNQVLSEKQAGKDPGAVDLVWINGENFATLKQADLLLDAWADKLPNSRLVNWDNPAINRDFGTPVNFQESPWSSAQFQLIYDTARMQPEDLPRSYIELKDWVKQNPGRFTYIAPGPGAFQGTRFVKGALYEISGKVEEWGTFDQALWDEYSPLLWDYLNEIEPYLWREGRTYPKDENELHNLFANQEIDFSITQAIVGAGALIEQGLVPDTAQAFVFDNYMIGDFNYVAIPVNAPNKAAALVLANLILEPELQAAQILPENGFGLGFGIDINRVTDSTVLEMLRDASRRLGKAATEPSDLAKSLVGDTAAEYQNLVEDGWREYVLQK